MTTWSYRVIRNAEGLCIFDVYYDQTGKPIGTHESPTCVSGETVDDLRDQLGRMLEALRQPVIEECEIDGK